MKDLPEGWKIVYQREDMKKPFFPITVIEGNENIYDQETFGPIFSLFEAKN